MTTQDRDRTGSGADDAHYVAGVGASAGGLESLEQLFRALPPRPGVAFIIVQHLSPDHSSLMEELLGRFTSMKVRRAEHDVEVLPNEVYTLPPGKEVEIAGGRLCLTDRQSDRSLSFPIDRFLTSLAADRGRRAIGIVLSGSGSDGSRGARAVHDHGGLVLVEEPNGAGFDGMPRAAIATGVADGVMAPRDLARAVLDHVSSGEVPDEGAAEQVEEVLGLLRNGRSVDFEDYKRGTIYRRLMRRVQARKFDRLEPYLELLRSDPSEVEALRDDLFIGVTSFVRDVPAFRALQQEIAAIVESAVEPKRHVRAWVAGCATGEEAYTIAIQFAEAIRASGSPRGFKIFATDAHEKALERAGAGVYDAGQLQNLQPALIERHFTQRDDGRFKVSAELRQHVVFAVHNVLSDTPFTNLDLVSCRNLLIYLRSKAQREALGNLSYGLRIGGLLMLGSSETPGELATSFETVSETLRLYRKRSHVRRLRRPAAFSRPPRALQREDWRQSDGGGLLPTYDLLLDRFMPMAFLVNSQRMLVDSYSGAESLLSISKRRPSMDFLDLVPDGVRVPVAAVLSRASKESGPVTYSRLAWPLPDDDDRECALTAERLQNRQGESFTLVIVRDLVPAHDAPARGADLPDDASSQRFVDLEQELSDARRSLQSTIEELEASNEELQATNEELMASNEELQSVNEELHSVNEELHTVNAEHQHKINELTELNRDVGHLLESLDVATIFLDNTLRIRKFTPKAHEIFGLVEHDVGRYLATFNHRLAYSTLSEDIERVHADGSRVEKEVRSLDGAWYFVRILPYRVGETVDGVLVTLTDATALAQQKSRARQLSAIVDSSADAIIGQTTDGIVTSWNKGAERIYGYPADEMIGESIMRLVPEEERDAMRALLGDIRRGADLINALAVRISRDGERLEIAKTVSPVRDARGDVVGVATIDRDVRAQRETERRLRDSERKYADLYNNAPDMYVSLDARTGRLLEFNDTFLQITGFTREAAEALHTLDLCTAESQDPMRRCLAAIREGGSVSNEPLTIRCADDSPLDVGLSATAVRDDDGDVVRLRAVLRDATATREAERQLREAALIREQFLAMASHELRSPLHAIGSAFQIMDASGTTSEMRQKSQRVIRRQARQMMRLVDDLLDVSRITHGKLALERGPVDLSRVVRDAVDAAAAAYHARGVTLKAEGLERSAPLFGDEGRLSQVFTNLLDNALRASPEDRSVTVKLERNGSGAVVRVIDEGRGIPGDKLGSIFGMFTQSAQGLARKEGGLGLGLTIAERIVAAHGGEVSAESEGENRGATFSVRLPLDDSAANLERPRPVADDQLSVVVVEDQDDAREMLAAVLQLDGHQVRTAADGEEGLQSILEARPALAFVDIGLPKLNGYELAAQVRAKLGDSVRLVALSGYSQPDDVKRALDSGFDRHISKPVEPDRLRGIVKQVVRGG